MTTATKGKQQVLTDRAQSPPEGVRDPNSGRAAGAGALLFFGILYYKKVLVVLQILKSEEERDKDAWLREGEATTERGSLEDALFGLGVCSGFWFHKEGAWKSPLHPNK